MRHSFAWLVIGTLSALATVGCSGPRFGDTALNTSPEKLHLLEERTALTLPSTSDESLIGSVGLVLVVDDASGKPPPAKFDRNKTIRQYRPTTDALKVQQIDTPLYEGIVTKDVSAGGSYTIFAGSLDSAHAASVVMRDTLFVGHKDRSKIPFAALSKLKLQDGKAYFFVESATLTTIVHRTFSKFDGNGAITGLAFGANGKVFVASSEYLLDEILTVDAFDLRLLQPTNGMNPQIAVALEGRVLTSEEADRVVNHLVSQSKNRALRLLNGSSLVLTDK